MRAQRVPLGGVERPLQQGAEDRRLDLAPAGPGRREEPVDLAAIQRERIAGRPGDLEQLAVETQDVFRQGGAEAAAVHVDPQRRHHPLQRRRVVLPAPQQPDEGAVAVVQPGQQVHVFREHREQAAREKGGDVLRRVAGRLEAARHARQLHRHLARDLGVGARRVEPRRIGPDQRQPLAQLGVAQVVEPDAVAARVGERRVGGAAAGELGIQLDHVAHVDHHHEGWAAFRRRQGPRIGFGLRPGAQQRVVETPGIGAESQLLGFQHEVAAPVAVDASVAGAAVTVLEAHRAFEHVVLLRGGMRLVHPQQHAQLQHEGLRRRQFTGGDTAPARYEILGRLLCCHQADDR